MHPGPQIKRLRQSNEWRLEDLANRVEAHLGKPINTGNLSRLERGKQGYSNELLQAVAAALEVEVAELFEADGPLQPIPKRPSLRYAHRGPDAPSASVEARQILSGLQVDDSVEVPRLEVRASMGMGLPRPGHDAIAGMMQLSAEWVRQRLPDITSARNLRVITGHGNSMEPTFFDGDPLLVDVGVHDVRVDRVYVFAMNDELYIKTLQRIPAGIRVISNNKTYEPYTIAEDTKHQVEILGVVCWVWNGRKP